MSTNLSLAGKSIKPVSSACGVGSTAWVVGTYYALPPIGNPPLEGSAEYEEMPIIFAGVNGVGTKNLGFRGRNIVIELIFVGATLDSAKSAKESLVDGSMIGERFSVTLPGSSVRPSCKLLRGGAQDLGWMNISGRAVVVVRFNIRQFALE